jgi:hypothetical protein
MFHVNFRMIFQQVVPPHFHIQVYNISTIFTLLHIFFISSSSLLVIPGGKENDGGGEFNYDIL